MKSEWCCSEFQERFFQSEGRQAGLGILWYVRSRATPVFRLDYRRPNRMPPEPIAEDGFKVKFCPWCGCSSPISPSLWDRAMLLIVLRRP